MNSRHIKAPTRYSSHDSKTSSILRRRGEQSSLHTPQLHSHKMAVEVMQYRAKGQLMRCARCPHRLADLWATEQTSKLEVEKNTTQELQIAREKNMAKDGDVEQGSEERIMSRGCEADDLATPPPDARVTNPLAQRHVDNEVNDSSKILNLKKSCEVGNLRRSTADADEVDDEMLQDSGACGLTPCHSPQEGMSMPSSPVLEMGLFTFGGKRAEGGSGSMDQRVSD